MWRVLVLVLCCSSWNVRTAYARVLPNSASSTGPKRTLQQQCPVRYCAHGSCVQRPGGRTLCTACQAPRVPNNAQAECVCPAGTYPSTGGACVDCQQNFFCPRAATNQPIPGAGAGQFMKRCPANTLTRRRGAKSAAACLNAPGYVLRPRAATTAATAPPAAAAVDVAVVAVPCGANEYNNGMDGATSCTPCPSRFVTDPEDEAGSHTSAAVCKAPPGYFVNGDSVAPCPAGSFSSEYSNETSCIDCEEVVGDGVTTAGPGANSSAACNVLQPGVAFVDLSTGQTVGGNTTKACPQSFYCPGGATPPSRCPRGLLTEAEGATSEAQCLAPPGWFLPDDEGSDMQECPSGTYKEGWDRSARCTPCGEGPWLSDRTSSIDILDPNTGETAEVKCVRGSPESCFIQQGMGVTKMSSSGALQAVICPVNFIGSSETRHGLSVAPCAACPKLTVTAGNDGRATSYNNTAGEAAVIAEGGYYSISACVAQSGYGYYGDGAQECPRGYFNAGGNLLSCTQCPIGTTTATTSATSAAECTLYAPGWGAALDGSTTRCPLGTFSDGTSSVTNKAACNKCPEGRTTPETGATSAAECSLCAAGYGGATAQQCKPCVDGSYNPLSGRMLDTTRCLACPVNRVFAFPWGDDVHEFVPLATSPAGATSQSDCLADFSQMVDGAFFLDLKEGPEFKSADEPSTVGSFQGCVQKCRDSTSCAAATFEYSEESCKLWHPGTAAPSSYAASGGIALKTVTSMSVPASVQTPADAGSEGAATAPTQAAAATAGEAALPASDSKVQAKVMGSGYYSYTAGSAAAAFISPSSLVSVAVTSLNDCLQACTFNNLCSGVVFGAFDASSGLIGDIAGAAAGTKCQRIEGTSLPGNSQRTLIKANYKSLGPN